MRVSGGCSSDFIPLERSGKKRDGHPVVTRERVGASSPRPNIQGDPHQGGPLNFSLFRLPLDKFLIYAILLARWALPIIPSSLAQSPLLDEGASDCGEEGCPAPTHGSSCSINN